MIGESRRHLDEAGETYLEHLHFALTVAILTMGAGLACVIHFHPRPLSTDLQPNHYTLAEPVRRPVQAVHRPSRSASGTHLRRASGA